MAVATDFTPAQATSAARSKVDLPHPEPPIMATISRGLMRAEKFSSAGLASR